MSQTTAVSLLFLVLAVGVVTADDSSITITNDNNTLLKNLSGTPLSQGTTANQDGTLIQLGYYSSATTSTKFLGNWIPIAIGLHMGDSAGNTGAGDGRLSFNLYFATNSNVVDVYDATFNPGHYTTTSSITITSTLPAPGQVLALRFYDSVNGSGGLFNAVSSNSWLWQTPTGPGTIYSLSFAAAGLEFQDAMHPYLTSIAVPEPSVICLIGIGLAGLSARRRRS